MDSSFEKAIIKKALSKVIDKGDYYVSPFELTDYAKKYVQNVVEAKINLDNALSDPEGLLDE